ncbi:hypothetical protein ACFQ4K_06675 [Tistrella bauzanensis]
MDTELAIRAAPCLSPRPGRRQHGGRGHVGRKWRSRPCRPQSGARAMSLDLSARHATTRAGSPARLALP